MSRLFLLAAVLCISGCTFVAAAEDITAIELETIVAGQTPAFIKFYAPWCGHCKRLAPTWKTLAEHYATTTKNVIIASVDCTREKAACQTHKIGGYPTLKFFEGHGGAGLSYSGGRSFEDLTSYVDEMVQELAPSDPTIDAAAPAAAQADAAAPEAEGTLIIRDSVYVANEASFPLLMTLEGYTFVKFYAPWCGHCKAMAPAWIELARRMASGSAEVRIAEVDCTANHNLCNAEGVEGFPTLTLYHRGVKIMDHKGDRKVSDLQDFLAINAAAAQPTAPPVRVEKNSDGVAVLTETNFDSGVAGDVVFVKAYAPWCGHCKRIAPIWIDLARRFRDTARVTIAELDCTVHPTVCQKQGVTGYPTLLVYHQGKKMSAYMGKRDRESLISFVKDQTQTLPNTHTEL